MVWIYGGSFVTGTSNVPTYNGIALAATGDVIVAVINYRLNVFGFLTTGRKKIAEESYFPLGEKKK